MFFLQWLQMVAGNGDNFILHPQNWYLPVHFSVYLNITVLLQNGCLIQDLPIFFQNEHFSVEDLNKKKTPHQTSRSKSDPRFAEKMFSIGSIGTIFTQGFVKKNVNNIQIGDFSHRIDSHRSVLAAICSVLSPRC